MIDDFLRHTLHYALNHPGPGEIPGVPPLVTVWMHTPRMRKL